MADHQGVRSTLILKSVKAAPFDKLLTDLTLTETLQIFQECSSLLHLHP